MDSIINKCNIRANIVAEEWQEAIIKAASMLVTNGYITQGYIEDIIQSVKELGPYIVIAPGLALAHARPSEKVLRNGLALATIKYPVAFDCENDPVKIIITLASTGNEAHIASLQQLVEVIEKDGILEEIGKAEDIDEIFKILSQK